MGSPRECSPSKDFRHRFIMAKDNLKVNSLDKNGRRTGPRGEKTKKFHYLSELRENKSLHLSSYEYSTVFRSNRPFLLNFFSQIRAIGGEIVPVQKNFRSMSRKSYSYSSLYPDLPLPHCGFNPSLFHVCAAYVPLCRLPPPAASGSLPNDSRLSHRERNFQQG